MADGLTAAIIAVGSELLTPHKTDTNSLFISEVLNDLGIAVAFKAIVGDNRAELASHVAHALSRHRVLILTRRSRSHRRRSHARSRGGPSRAGARRGSGDHRRRSSGASRRAAGRCRRSTGARPWCRGARSSSTIRMGPRPACGSSTARRCDRAAARSAPRDEADDGRRGSPPSRRVAGDVRLHRRLVRVAGKGESAVEEIVQPIYSRWLSQSPPIDTTILAGLGQVELHLVTQSADAAAAAEALDIALSALVRRLARISSAPTAPRSRRWSAICCARAAGGWRWRSRARAGSRHRG